MNKIDENLCVNNNVTQMGHEIMVELKNNLKNAKTYISKEYNRIIKKGSFIYKTKGKLPIDKITVNYLVYPYDNMEEYNSDYKSGAITLDCECGFEERAIFINIATVNNEIVQESIGNIEHELNHILQCSFGQKQNESLYEKVVEQCYHNNGLYQMVAYALYLSFKTEIASFTVQYYTFLKNNNVPLCDIFHSFSNDENNPYKIFLDNYNYVMSHESKINDEEIRRLFGITKNELLKRLENANKRYKMKMMKAIMKYRDELNENYVKEKIKKKHVFLEIHQLQFAKRMNFLCECYNKGIHDEASEYE